MSLACRCNPDAQPPRYPTSAMRDRMGAEVLMRVAVRADGSVAEVEPRARPRLANGSAAKTPIRRRSSHLFNPPPPQSKAGVSATLRHRQWRRRICWCQSSIRCRHQDKSARQHKCPCCLMSKMSKHALADLLSPENRLGSDPSAPISLEPESRIQPLEESSESSVAL